MLKTGVGASVARKEDDRFLRGRGQYVGDFHVPGMREVAFVRSTLAHARVRGVAVPPEHVGAVFTAKDLAGVKPIRAATARSCDCCAKRSMSSRDTSQRSATFSAVKPIGM